MRRLSFTGRSDVIFPAVFWFVVLDSSFFAVLNGKMQTGWFYCWLMTYNEFPDWAMISQKLWNVLNGSCIV